MWIPFAYQNSVKTLHSSLNSKCKGPQAGKRDSKEATTAGVQRARERKWWQKVESRVGNTQGLAGLADCERSFWRIWIRSRAWYDLYLNLELPLWLFCGSQETEAVFQTQCGSGSSKVKETGNLDTYFGGRTHRFADRLGGCLLICDSALPQKFFLPTRARFTGLNRTTKQEHRWWLCAESLHLKATGSQRRASLSKDGKEWRHGWEVCIWNDQGFPEKLRGEGAFKVQI